MKKLTCIAFALVVTSINLLAQTKSSTPQPQNHLFIDVHRLPSGKVSYDEVAAAHAKDLAVQGKYNVQFLKYWVDEANGTVYCLSSARDTAAISKTHNEAHGLLPQEFLSVKDGIAADKITEQPFFLDIHQMPAGNVTAADVEGAHQKDLAVQGKHGVSFVNYWVDEKKGTILCLSQAGNASHVIQTHKEAHGLLPVSVTKVKQGQ